MKILILLLLTTFTRPAFAQTYLSAEGDLTWQTRNDQRVPGNSGTPFALTDFGKGPFPTGRIYVGHILNKRHEFRALYAPLEFKVNGRFDETVNYAGGVFAPGTDTEGFYKFNSYRLTYAYHFESSGDWEFALGFTGKIRDAEVRLSQGPLVASKSNVGFVPLLNLQAVRKIGDRWAFRFDADGLAAPQGRAFDVALFIERRFENGFKAFGGYRTIEGGADNAEVYNFAWIHKLVLGARCEF